MEIGPTMHYVMGGVMVDAETQMSTVPGLFAAGECSADSWREPPGRKFAFGSACFRETLGGIRGEVLEGNRRER